MMEVKRNEALFLLTDSLDSELVEREMKGEKVEELVYEVVTPRGVEYTLTAVGVRVLAQLLSRQHKKPVRTVECRVDKLTTDGRDYIIALALAENEIGFQWVGSAVQPTHKGGRFDPFCVPKATTKAQRNALRGVIPPHIIDDFIQQCLKENKVKRVVLEEEPKEEEKITIETRSEEDIEESVPSPTALETEEALWSEVYRRARRKWGEDFKEHLFLLVHTLFGKRHLSVTQLKQLLNALDEI